MGKGNETKMEDLLDAEKMVALRFAGIDTDIAVIKEKIEPIEKLQTRVGKLNNMARTNRNWLLLIGAALTILSTAFGAAIVNWIS